MSLMDLLAKLLNRSGKVRRNPEYQSQEELNSARQRAEELRQRLEALGIQVNVIGRSERPKSE